MKLEDLPDDFTPEQFRRLDRESLDQVPYTLMKWVCFCTGCNNGTKIRDYGIGWYLLHRNSKRSHTIPEDYWRGRNNIYLCGKHGYLFDKLENRFDIAHIYRRLFGDDYATRPQQRIVIKEITMNNKIDVK